MASLRLRAFGAIEEEVEGMLADPVPGWLVRACEVAGVTAAPPPPSILAAASGELVNRRMEALSTLLRRAELIGWRARFEGPWVLLITGLAPRAAIEAMKRDGTWAIARRLARRDAAGEVAWE